MAGFPPEDAIWLVLVPNGINFFATIAGVALVERLGRKKLTIASFIGKLLLSLTMNYRSNRCTCSFVVVVLTSFA